MVDKKSNKVEKPEVEMIKVNRKAENWDPLAEFYGFKYRAILVEEPSLIKAISRRSDLSEKMKKQAGVEGRDWIIRTSTDLDEYDVIYFRNSAFLLLWKITDLDNYEKTFSKIEEHDESAD